MALTPSTNSLFLDFAIFNSLSSFSASISFRSTPDFIMLAKAFEPYLVYISSLPCDTKSCSILIFSLSISISLYIYNLTNVFSPMLGMLYSIIFLAIIFNIPSLSALILIFLSILSSLAFILDTINSCLLSNEKLYANFNLAFASMFSICATQPLVSVPQYSSV